MSAPGAPGGRRGSYHSPVTQSARPLEPLRTGSMLSSCEWTSVVADARVLLFLPSIPHYFDTNEKQGFRAESRSTAPIQDETLCKFELYCQRFASLMRVNPTVLGMAPRRNQPEDRVVWPNRVGQTISGHRRTVSCMRTLFVAHCSRRTREMCPGTVSIKGRSLRLCNCRNSNLSNNRVSCNFSPTIFLSPPRCPRPPPASSTQIS